jgi:hypothetical protein
VVNWLKRNTTAADTIISSLQGLDYYYSDIDYFYMNQSDRRFSGWSCRGGQVERWGNTPLLYTTVAFQAQLESGSRVFYVVRQREIEDILPSVVQWQPRVLWRDDTTAILGFKEASAGGTGSEVE